jgi:hypothetical protein
MTAKPPRLGDITDEAARALELIAKIEASPGADVKLLCALLKQVVLDLDERGLLPEVTRAGDMLAVALRRLPDKPADEPDPEELARLLREWKARG